MLRSVKGEYARRGKTLERTGWSVFEVHEFMQAWLANVKPGEDVGIRAHQLPKRPNDQEPAKMPDWVKKFHAERGEAEAEEESKEPEADYPTQGYKVRRGSSRSPWQLNHAEIQSVVELPPLTNKEAKYYVYQSRDGDCLWNTDESSEPQFCKDIFEQLLGARTTTGSKARGGAGAVSAGSPNMPGQVVHSGPFYNLLLLGWLIFLLIILYKY